MSLLLMDIGGSSVKYGVWNQNQLTATASFVTPATWSAMKSAMVQVQTELAQQFTFTGVAISAPGNVKYAEGYIGGLSAIPYLHNFPILKEWEDLFNLPVTMENDANCAGFAEIWQGDGRNQDVVSFLVIGSGLGGANFVDGKLVRGGHGYGGEFGFGQFYDDQDNWSVHGSPVQMADRYNAANGTAVSGKDIFDAAKNGDTVAKEYVENFYQAIAKGIFNISFILDPDMFILGGTITNNPDLVPSVKKHVQAMYDAIDIADMTPTITVGKFGADANLIGAAAVFYGHYPA
ncbi:ROK family protein [Periweissella cryptocerci]|uniref:ROK family protein n=1 Tax=Periweissella cryptocerci TaxID=2506420 RepID=A0A4P6YUR7_9LACO|nr:ROK family protein [Periweissella cryptocerci]QBO36481.1 ROK family protein [Periweissella cryptocerci]